MILESTLVVWLILIVAEILHGIVRAVFLVPLVGDFRSSQIGVFSGSIIIPVIAFIICAMGWRDSSGAVASGRLVLRPPCVKQRVSPTTE
jgi:hypothetical protein